MDCVPWPNSVIQEIFVFVLPYFVSSFSQSYGRFPRNAVYGGPLGKRVWSISIGRELRGAVGSLDRSTAGLVYTSLSGHAELPPVIVE